MELASLHTCYGDYDMSEFVSQVLLDTERAGKAADQKYCHSCGYVLHHSATSCPSCGAVQATTALAPHQQVGGLAVTPASVAPGLPQNHVYCRGCGAGIHESATTCPKCGAPQHKHGNYSGSGKTRITAALLAFLLGGFGFHRFYLGKIFTGLLYLFFCWTFIPFIVAFLEGIYYLTLSDDEFARKF